MILSLRVHAVTKLSMCFLQVKNGESRIRPKKLCVVVNGIMVLFSLIIGGLEIFFLVNIIRIFFKELSYRLMSCNHLLCIFIAFCNLFVAIYTLSAMKNSERSCANISVCTSDTFRGSDNKIMKRIGDKITP